MKMLAHVLIVSFSFALGLQVAQAQQFKAETQGAKKITINQLFGKITLKESTGNQLIISVENLEEVKTPEKAKGLQPLSQNGVENTGIGLHVENSGSVITIQGASKKSMEGIYSFQIPKGISVIVDYSNPFTYGEVVVDGFSSELEISSLHEDMQLKNVTGPLVLHSISGNIKVDFSTVNQQSPISITAINGEIDLTMPASTPANLTMGTMQGEVYTNFDIAFDRKEKEGMTLIGGGQDIEGKINKGGVEITLKSINDNIYLRKK